MSQLPILFKTDMVQSILAGRKTVTRRIVSAGTTTGFSVKKKSLDFSQIYGNGKFGVKVAGEDGTLWRGQCLYQPGDYLYVKETWKPASWSEDGDMWNIVYKAGGRQKVRHLFEDGEKEADFYIRLTHNLIRSGCKTEDGMFVNPEPLVKWKPSIFMPKNAARIWLRVKSVKAERLQDITEEDAYREGLRYNTHPAITARFAFAELWDSINEKRGFGWDTNPYVWRIEFERVASQNDR